MGIIYLDLSREYGYFLGNKLLDLYGFKLCLPVVPKDGWIEKDQIPEPIHCDRIIHYYWNWWHELKRWKY